MIHEEFWIHYSVLDKSEFILEQKWLQNFQQVSQVQIFLLDYEFTSKFEVNHLEKKPHIFKG